MSDPFGALATQRIGDLGVHIGQGSWAGTSQQSSVTAVIGTGADTAISPNPAYPNGKLIQFYDGTASNPATHETPSVKIFRTEKITSPSHNLDPGYSAALSVQVRSMSGNKNQPQAIWGQASGYAESPSAGIVNFNIGGYFVGIHESGPVGTPGGANTGGANATFGVATTSIVGGRAWVYASLCYNNTGGNGTSAQADFACVDAVYDASGNNYGGNAFQVRSAQGGSRVWDVGFRVFDSSVRTASFYSSCDALFGLAITGDNSQAGIYVLNNNAFSYAQKWERTTATAATWGMILTTTGIFDIDEVGVAQKFQIIPGTPGVNFTDLAIQEGAGPTLRRLKTFDPGNLGVNFTAGQLVCILV